jgi:hypothetical protein
MIPWIIIGAVMVLQGTFRLAHLSMPEWPVWFGIALPVLVISLIIVANAAQRIALLLFAVGLTIGANAGPLRLSQTAAGVAWLLPGLGLIAYSLLTGQRLERSKFQLPIWWKIGALILLALVILLPPISC